MTTELTRQAEVATTGWCQPKQLCDSRNRTEEWRNHLAENQAPGTPELQTAKVRLRSSQGTALPELPQSCLEGAPVIEASVLQVCHTRVKHHRPHIGRTCATGNSAQRRFDLERYTCEGHKRGTNVFYFVTHLLQAPQGVFREACSAHFGRAWHLLCRKWARERVAKVLV